MSARLMLDTNAVSAIAKGQAGDLSDFLNDKQICVSVIAEAELRFGLARRAVNADLRRIVENFLGSVDILPWTSACAQRYGLLRTELEALGKPLAPMDLLIATHALAEGCVLISADRAFSRVPGLRVLDWKSDVGSAPGGSSAQGDRGKQVQEKVAQYAIQGAAAQARTAIRKSPPKPKAGKKIQSD